MQMLAAIRTIKRQKQGPIDPTTVLKTPSGFKEWFLQSDFRKLSQISGRTLSRVQYDIDTQIEKLPLQSPKPAVELRRISPTGLLRKNLTDAVYQERLEHELGIILPKSGFWWLFLDCLGRFVSDGVRLLLNRMGHWVCCRLTGAALSYRDWSCGENLLFERFLNVGRYTMPGYWYWYSWYLSSRRIYPLMCERTVTRSCPCSSDRDLAFEGGSSAKRCLQTFWGTWEYELTSIAKRIGFRDTHWRQLMNKI